MMNIIYEPIKNLNNHKCNTANLFIQEDRTAPDDYRVVFESCKFSSFKHLKSDDDVVQIHLDASVSAKLKKFAASSHALGYASNVVFEDINDFLASREFTNLRQHIASQLRDNTEYFVRTEYASLKRLLAKHHVVYNDSKYTGQTLSKLFHDLVFCHYDHKAVDDEQADNIVLYFVKWQQLRLEFRAFVHQGRLTAICPQHYYSYNDGYGKVCEKEVQRVAEFVHEKLSQVGNVVLDIAILQDDSVYFVEVNPFGGDYGSGSALFDWRQDHYKLTHTDNCIYFRYLEK